MFSFFNYRMTIVALLGMVALASGCVREGSGDLYDMAYSVEFYPAMPHLQTRVQEAFVNARPGERFVFKRGTYHFNSTLSLEGVDGIIIEGQGMNETVFSFDNQIAGAEGLKLTNCDDLILANFSVKDTKGDAVKVKDADGVTFYQVGVDWTGEPDITNGAYGLYPVSAQNILIDRCYVRGASDAGIYVGQTSNCIIRNSLVEMCVAGIEIENTSNADVHNNVARRNTGGILVFDLPEIPIKNGTKNRVYNNDVYQNDYPNFASPAGMVSKVPPGTGILLLSAQEVEVFNNNIAQNNIMGIGVFSYQTITALDPDLNYNDPEYDPYSRGVYIHDNTMSRSNNLPPYVHAISLVISNLFVGSDIPDILFDGFLPAGSSDADRICVKNNGTAGFANLDVAGDFVNVSTDLTPHDCTQASLPTPVVDAPVYPHP
ncbi:MAG: right-handed parallel beta-helix repeat-containing protein [Sphingobacteriales bacterium]|nr:right-handed parallel beta-helix repeat-containing protein [Sphingobacteriales bacterium]